MCICAGGPGSFGSTAYIVPDRLQRFERLIMRGLELDFLIMDILVSSEMSMRVLTTIRRRFLVADIILSVCMPLELFTSPNTFLSGPCRFSH